MRWGLIARSDQGGLANLTWELWRHLHPDVTLVVEMGGAGQGTDGRWKYGAPSDALRYVPGPALPPAAFQVFAGCDLVVTAETFYHPAEYGPLDAMGVATLGLVMPELHAQRIARTELLPTLWERERVPGADVLPVPVATDVLDRPWISTAVQAFYHPSAPAMLDRNGTDLVRDAQLHVTAPCTVEVGGAVGSRTEAYWKAYPATAQALLLPRRYAGLCLPAQEAAALGMPLVCLDTEPLRSLPFALTVPATVKSEQLMKGGTFPVHTCAPEALAAAMDELCNDAALYRTLADNARVWARGHSWEALTPLWRDALAAAASA